MKIARLPFRLASFTILVLALAGTAIAGPPFVIDDPEPAELHHWEVYVSSTSSHTADGWSATLPALEINYGAIPDVHLHIIAPLAFNKPARQRAQYGYSDTELGFKYRFLHESTWLPQAAIFPVVQLPTGSERRGLGNGEAQFFLPLWFQKSFGHWSSCAGGGYTFNSAGNSRNSCIFGWQVQRKITDGFTVGAEIFHETAKEQGGSSDTKMNLGVIYDVGETYHLLISGGHTVQGPSEFISFVALQMTFGPKEKKESK